MQTDLLLTNGRIWCGAGLPEAQALAIADGKIAALGTTAAIQSLRTTATRHIDLRGRLVTPGLIDAHIHLLAVGLNMSDVDLRGTRSLAEQLTRLKQRVAESRPGQWIKAVGHDEQLLDVQRHPTLDELDAAAPENPLYIVRSCGHIYICNSQALALAGIDASSPPPPGGVVDLANGRLTGMIAETTRELIKAAVPRRSVADLKSGILRGARHLASLGITGAMEAGAGRLTNSVEEFTAFHELAKDRALPVHVYLGLTAGEKGILDAVRAAGHRFGDGNDLLRIGPAKLHTDGSAGGRTAAMTQPYVGEGCSCGVLIHTDEEFARKVVQRHREGFQVAVHSIGDRAIEQTIAAFEQADRIAPVAGRRHRIEHCGFPTTQQIQRMRDLGLVPSPQPVFMHDFGDTYMKVLGAERAAAGYPLRSWLAAGLTPALGTDSPVSAPDPMANLLAAVTRRTRAGAVLGPEESVDIEAALTAYTFGGAFAQFQESTRGTLRPGFQADLSVFSTDFTRDPAATLAQTQCDLTLLGGRITHDRLGEAGGSE